MRILFITPRIPFPPIKGDRLRSYHFMRELSKRHAVDLCTFYENPKELEGVAELHKYCGTIETVLLTKVRSYINIIRSIFNFKPFQVNYYYSTEMRIKIRRILRKNKYDIVHIVLQRMVPYASCLNGEKIVLDQIDALSLNMKRRAYIERNIFTKTILYCEYLIIKNYEHSNQNKYDRSIITSEEDKNALGDTAIRVIPNGVATRYFIPKETPKDIDLLFTGNMSYFPNVDAMVYFCKEILPKIAKSTPTISLYIVGVDPAKEIRDLHDNKNVFVLGFVNDLRIYLQRAKIFVAPLRAGSGIQNKILEAMSCALPVVTTSYGNAGIKAQSNKEIILANDPDTFKDNIIKLLNNNVDRERIGKEARIFIEKEFSWEHRIEMLEKVYEKIATSS